MALFDDGYITYYSIMVMPVIGLCMNNQSHQDSLIKYHSINQVMQHPQQTLPFVYSHTHSNVQMKECCRLLYSHTSLSSIIIPCLLAQVLVCIIMMGTNPVDEI